MTLWQLFKAIPRAIAGLIVGIGTFLAKQWNQYTEFGQFLWILALCAMAVDAGISYEFGSTLSYLHAGGFALVALAFCILPDVAALEWRKGRKVAGGWIAAACVPLGLVAFLTHVGYSASIRVGDMQQSSAQNANWQAARDQVTDYKADLTMWQNRLTELERQLAESAGWSTTVAPDGLKAEVQAMEGDRIYRRSKECANVTLPESRAFCDKLAGIKGRVASATEAYGLRDKIDATNRKIAEARGVAAKTEFKSSAAANHNDTLFKAANLLFSGNFKEAVSMDEREATNTGIMGISSIAFLLLAPLFYFAAGLNRRANVMDEWMPTGVNVKGLSLKNANLGTLHAAPAKPETLVMEKVINNHIDDRMALKNIQAALRDVFGAPATA